MKKIRYLPFGYTIRNGQTVIDQQEAETVRGIFTAYIHGASLKEIAEDLTAKNIPYTERSCVWDKARISRILENAKYTGDAEFDAIIEDAVYGEAVAAKSARTSTPSGPSGKAGRAATLPAACGCESAMVNCSKRSRCL